MGDKATKGEERHTIETKVPHSRGTRGTRGTPHSVHTVHLVHAVPRINCNNRNNPSQPLLYVSVPSGGPASARRSIAVIADNPKTSRNSLIPNRFQNPIIGDTPSHIILPRRPKASHRTKRNNCNNPRLVTKNHPQRSIAVIADNPNPSHNALKFSSFQKPIIGDTPSPIIPITISPLKTQPIDARPQTTFLLYGFAAFAAFVVPSLGDVATWRFTPSLLSPIIPARSASISTLAYSKTRLSAIPHRT